MITEELKKLYCTYTGHEPEAMPSWAVGLLGHAYIGNPLTNPTTGHLAEVTE